MDERVRSLHHQAMHRVFASLLLLLSTPCAWAQTRAVDEYLAAVDRGETALTREYGSCVDAKPDFKMDEYNAAAERLNHELEIVMRRVIGPVTPPRPFSGPGELNPGLGCGLGMDALDGIRFWTGAGDNWSTLLVTTGDLLRRWLKRYEPEHPQWQADLDAAFASGELNTEMIDREAWREVFATLPVDKPAGVDAVFAFLGQSGNGSVIWPPTMVSVYLRKRDRIFLVDLALDTKFTPIVACGDPNQPEPSDENAERFNKCWKQRGAQEPAFVAAGRQAQAFVNALAAVE
jgi:hypothetical protein